MEDEYLYLAQTAGTQGNVNLTFTNSDSDTFTVTLYNAVITSYDDAINTVGRIERTVTCQGLADSSNPAFKIIIVNQDSSAIAN